jgi:hypothetical protein
MLTASGRTATVESASAGRDGPTRRGRRRGGLLALAVGLALVVCALGSPTAFAVSHERPNGSVVATCSSITFNYKNFPNANNNTVTEQVYIHGTLVKTVVFEFNGPTGSSTIPITVGPEPGIVDGNARWDTNGFRGNWDIPTYLKCADPGFTIEKLQKIEGSGEPFTTAPLKAEAGQTVLYEIIVTDTGNTSLTFTNFIDAKCDSGTIAGGPSGPLAPGESATYTCSHVLGSSNKTTASYENNAKVTGAPPEKQGVTKQRTSNTVVVTTPGSNHERPNGSLTATCESITFNFKNFPNAPNNTVTEEIFIHGKRPPKVVVFSFNGPTGSNTVAITVPPGPGLIDGRAKWKTNGVKGGFDLAYNLNCPAKPAFTIEKLQKIAGGGEFTKEQLAGELAQTIEYEIIVKDTGNTSLTFSNFTDTKCDSGTIAGGPSGPLEPGQSATYTCNHVITPTDQLAGSYENNATDTGTPPEGQGSPITHTSNTVVVAVT